MLGLVEIFGIFFNFGVDSGHFGVLALGERSESACEETLTLTFLFLLVHAREILGHEVKRVNLVLIAKHLNLCGNASSLHTNKHNLGGGGRKRKLNAAKVRRRVELEFGLLGLASKPVSATVDGGLEFFVSLAKPALLHVSDGAVVAEITLG